jgi:dTDP-glucose pyrophosphorylase
VEKNKIEYFKQINIVIPMAGHGTRFAISKYKKQKPFIEIHNKSMIERVLSNAKEITKSRISLIVRRGQYSINSESFQNLGSDIDIYFVNDINAGAVCSVLAAVDAINNKKELLIMNCDQQLKKGVLKDFVNNARLSRAGGSIITFEENEGNKKWSYAKTNDSGHIEKIAEKDPISNFATVGVYYYRKGKNFVNCAAKMIADNDKTNNEFYIAPVYNYLSHYTSAPITNFCIDKKSFGCFGTPEDLEKFKLNTFLSMDSL